MERALEETFDRKVVVMHVQSAGADTSPAGHGDLDCNIHPGDSNDDPCLGWLSAEGHGRVGLPTLTAAWTAAGANMKGSIALSMVTRSIELGPYPETFTIRGMASPLAWGGRVYAGFSDGYLAALAGKTPSARPRSSCISAITTRAPSSRSAKCLTFRVARVARRAVTIPAIIVSRRSTVRPFLRRRA